MDTPQTMAAALARAAAAVTPQAQAIVSAATTRTRVQARRNSEASSGKAARHAPGEISSETWLAPGIVGGEVGYEARGQGRLGILLEYGSVNNPPHRDLSRALEPEENRMYAEIAAMTIRLLS